MDIHFWKQLPTQTCLTLYLYANNKKEKVYCQYFHCTENCVYFKYNLENNYYEGERSSFFLFENGNVILNQETNTFTLGTILTSIKIKSIKKSNELPLLFSLIDKKYLNVVNSHFKELHLAHDFRDQGWDDIFYGNQFEHLYECG